MCLTITFTTGQTGTGPVRACVSYGTHEILVSLVNGAAEPHTTSLSCFYRFGRFAIQVSKCPNLDIASNCKLLQILL